MIVVLVGAIILAVLVAVAALFVGAFLAAMACLALLAVGVAWALERLGWVSIRSEK